MRRAFPALLIATALLAFSPKVHASSVTPQDFPLTLNQCTVSVAAPTYGATVSNHISIVLSEPSACGATLYNQVYASGPGYANPLRFTGNVYEFDTTGLPNEWIKLSATVWSDPNYVNGPIATSSDWWILVNNQLAGVPYRANDVLNTMGAATHHIQGGETKQAIINGLTYTGIRNIRDDATHNNTLIDDLCAIHAATGVMVDELPIVDSDPNNLMDTQVEWDRLAACGAFLAGEGPNEPNNFSFHYQGNSCGPYGGPWYACAAFQRDIYQLVHTDPALAGHQVWGQTEVGAQSENMGLQFLTIPSSGTYPFPAGTQFADTANVHNYTNGNGGNNVYDNQDQIAESVPRVSLFQPDLCNEYWGATWAHVFPAAIPCEPDGNGAQNYYPKVTTEANYFPNSSVNATLQGKMISELYLQAVNSGFQNTFIYPLFNDSTTSSAGGFFNVSGDEGDSGNATPLGTYTHNLTTIIADNSSAFTPVSVPYTITGLPSTGYSLLMQKSSGLYELAIWGEAFVSQTSTPVTVTFPAAVPTVNVYDVTVGTAPVVHNNVTSVSFPIIDHARIVEFSGSTLRGLHMPSKPLVHGVLPARVPATTVAMPKWTPGDAKKGR